MPEKSIWKFCNKEEFKEKEAIPINSDLYYIKGVKTL